VSAVSSIQILRQHHWPYSRWLPGYEKAMAAISKKYFVAHHRQCSAARQRLKIYRRGFGELEPHEELNAISTATRVL